MSSGLYESLLEMKALIGHEEARIAGPQAHLAYKILKPEKIPFISYPYEWSFSQLKHAALMTLEIQRKALDYGMILKDGSAYNIQFKNGRPILIDTLSFEKYVKGCPWVGYRQFCEHFLAPLALMSYTDLRLNQLLRIYMDGVPLDLASKLLPLKSCLNFAILSHIHIHSRNQKYFRNKSFSLAGHGIGLDSLKALLGNLESAVNRMEVRDHESDWSHYYGDPELAFGWAEDKKKIVANTLDKTAPRCVWDLGANTGEFSFIAGAKGANTISMDVDPAAVEKNYLLCVEKKIFNVLPLLVDLTNPSADIGWDNEERASLVNRGPADVVFALALIHHLVITHNIPIQKLARFFSKIAKKLLIEFVPQSDEKVQIMLTRKSKGLPDYHRENFEKEFKMYFNFEPGEPIGASQRVVYFMENRAAL